MKTKNVRNLAFSIWNLAFGNQMLEVRGQKITNNQMLNAKCQTQKGITLIALIITVIILLILAGTAISIGINGGDIFSKTESATQKSNMKSLRESVGIAYVMSKADEREDTFKENLENQMKDVVITEVEGHSDILQVEQNNTVVTVYENGEILDGGLKIWDGSTIECPELKRKGNVWNWYIYTPEQLKFLEVFVNNGNSLTGGTNLTSYVADAGYSTENVVMTPDATIYLMNNLDLGARQENGTLVEGTMWTPIGINIDNVTDKLGTFEGNNYCIKGVYVKRNEDNNGLFAHSNTVQNLTIRDSYIEGNRFAGGITANLCNGKVDNCHNYSTIVKGDSCIGGIVGSASSLVINCSNSGTLICKNVTDCRATGGIVGRALGEDENDVIIRNCVNNGEVNGKGMYVGGLVGYLKYGLVEKCINNGAVKHTKSSSGYQQDVGGIVGVAISGKKISMCINNGSVEGEYCFIGGIAGRVLGTVLIENCYNIGNVKGNGIIGGIVGYSANSASNIVNCYNIGHISGETYMGGIFGSNANSSTTNNSYYLTGTATSDFGNTSSSNLVKNKEYLTNDFVTTANQNGIIWEVIEGKNNGFPILINQ